MTTLRKENAIQYFEASIQNLSAATSMLLMEQSNQTTTNLEKLKSTGRIIQEFISNSISEANNILIDYSSDMRADLREHFIKVIKKYYSKITDKQPLVA